MRKYTFLGINDLKFWCLYLLLNSTLFLPAYLLDAEVSTFVPYSELLSGSLQSRFDFLYERENSDIFRLSIDMFVLVSICYMLRKRLKIWSLSALLSLYYLLMLFYLMYHQFIERVYDVPPVLYNDVHLMQMGISLLLSDFSWMTMLVAVAVFVSVLIIVFAVRSLISCFYAGRLGTATKVIMVALGLVAAVNTWRNGVQWQSSQGLQVHASAVMQNIVLSREARKSLENFDIETFLRSSDAYMYSLRRRPNIYLLFIESYGKVLLDDPELARSYQEYIHESERIMQQDKWHIASHLSRSPVSGGRSWISYATVLYGYNFRNQDQYLALFRNPAVHRYNHLLRFLKFNGYKNYRLKSLYPGYYNMAQSWVTDSSFYAVDEWIRFRDFGYTGKLHGFGPAPSDQYSLHFAYHLIKKKSGAGPFTLFFLNQNSHRPFDSPDKVADDWQNLNDGSIDFNTPSRLFATTTIADYESAISYQIHYITDFIVRNGSDNDIFVLIGDHQPPVFSSNKNGFETPMHIISRDRDFVTGFLQYGFSEGLLVRNRSAAMKHEGFYSMFLREFVRHYGVEFEELPEYLPDGVVFKADPGSES